MRCRAALAVLLLGVTGCSATSPTPSGPGTSGTGSDPGPATVDPDGDADAPLPVSEVGPLAAVLPELALAPLPRMRMVDGLTPPTNRWFSGLVLGTEPQPVFALPLALTVSDTSVGAGLPQVVTSEDSIVGSHQSDVTLGVTDAASTSVSAYDEASVTLETRDSGGGVLGRTTVAEGWPFVAHVAAAAETLSTSVAFTGSGDVVSAETATGTWGLRLDGASVDGDTVTLAAGDSVVLFPVPDDGSLETMAAAAVPLVTTSVAYAVGDEEVRTRIDYGTGGPPTARALLPHHVDDPARPCGADDELGSFASVYGSMPVCSGSSTTWTAERREPRAALDLSGLTRAHRDALADQVVDDVAALPDPPADTYFGGKWLYRTAQLMALADQVGEDDAHDLAADRLSEELGRWAEVGGCEDRAASCFGYDPAWRGVVGQATAFGSEVFNDHHFHYGYFLYAAAVLAADRPDEVEDLRPVMTMLAADVAGGSDTGVTPRRRVFDAWASHSWAAGTGDFADGNNQESSSEAVTAWAGLALWAQAVDDEALARQADWMMALEADAARTYWTDLDTSDPVYDGFEHVAMGINWGGKRDWATWFSAEPSAVLGIQLIPMSPSSGYLADDPERIPAAARAATTGPLADYVLMYAGLAGPADATAALDRVDDLDDDEIDDGSSRSYLMAHLMALADVG